MNWERLAKTFKALSNQNRLKILEAIWAYQKCCPEGIGTADDDTGKLCCCVEEISGNVDMAQSTLSQHLKELYNAGLLQREKKAQWVYYRLRRDGMDEIMEFLAHFSAEGGS